jgi:hypothetical protein
MVRGDDSLLDAIGAFVLGTPLGDWCMASSRMFRRVRPTASLFRVDWRAERAVAMTLYTKFPKPPTDAEFTELVAVARPSVWYGPSPIAVAEALGLAGPTGIALRQTQAGSVQLAVYYRIEIRHRALAPSTIARLAEAANVSLSANRFAADSVTLSRTCPLSVIGLEGGSLESLGVLKFDWSEVPLRIARAFIASKGASPRALARFDELCNSFRARLLSYFGMKYNSAGFAGWRAYFSTEPSRYIPVGLPSVHAIDGSPGSRMPHY